MPAWRILVSVELKLGITGGLTMHLLQLFNTNPGEPVDWERYPPTQSNQLRLQSPGGQIMLTVMYRLGSNLPKAPML